MVEASAGEFVTSCRVTGNRDDPRYVQRIQCGRHQLLADEPPILGGADAGPTPFGYLVCALGACTSMTLRMYAERRQWDLGTIDVTVELRRRAGTNYIERAVSISTPLTDEQRKTLADICERTPVTLAVKSGITIHTALQYEQRP
jgi:putative redox protein